MSSFEDIGKVKNSVTSLEKRDLPTLNLHDELSDDMYN